MTTAVQRLGAAHGQENGLHTLEQKFRFRGATVDRIAEVVWTAPLVGPGSVFGERPGARAHDEGITRTVLDFAPAPGFRFDVILHRHRDPGVYVVRFAQPGRRTPYLAGEFVWLLSEDEDGAIFDEQINTAQAREYTDEPLAGEGTSLRRWLFFRVGHARVMDQAMRNIAALAVV